MERTQHPSNNAVIGAPVGWDQGTLPCSALPITRLDEDGLPVMVSFWRPSAEELARLNTGGSVSLWIYGTEHPVVSVGAEP